VVETVAFAPRVRANEETALPRDAYREATRGQDERPLMSMYIYITSGRKGQSVVSDSADERVPQGHGVVATARCARIVRVLP
jgi:hypothetical protein